MICYWVKDFSPVSYFGGIVCFRLGDTITVGCIHVSLVCLFIIDKSDWVKGLAGLF